MAKQKNNPLTDALAKELGYKDAEELKDSLGKDPSGRGGRASTGLGGFGGSGGIGTGFLGGKEVASGFGVGVKGRLAKGQSIKESFAGGFKDFKSTLSLENIKRRGLEKTFGGSGFISSFARGQLKKKFGTSPTKPTKESDGGVEEGSDGLNQRGLNSISKNALFLRAISKEVSAIKQILLKSDKKGKSSKVRAGALDFFKAEDLKEAKKEEEFSKSPTPEGKEEKPKEEDDKGFFSKLLDDIFGLIKAGLLLAFASLLNPKAILKALGKIFVIGAILGSLFSGITAAFDRWKETGSIYEAIVAGLGALVDFLTFGLFGEDSIRKMFEGIGKFLDPIITSVGEVVVGLAEWIGKNVGIPETTFNVIGKDFTLFKGGFYPFKEGAKALRSGFEEYKKSKIITSEEDVKAGKEKREAAKEGKSDSESKAPSKAEEPESKAPSKASSSLSLEEQDKITEKVLVLGDKFKAVLLEAAKAADAGDYEKAKGLLAEADKLKAEGQELIAQLPDDYITPAGRKASGQVSAGAAGGGGAVGAGGGGGGEVSAAGGGGGGGAGGKGGEVSAGGSAGTGNEISTASADVAEAQRMESAADQGSSIDASSTNNSSGSMGGSPQKMADVYDTEFANLYSMA